MLTLTDVASIGQGRGDTLAPTCSTVDPADKLILAGFPERDRQIHGKACFALLPGIALAVPDKHLKQ